MAMSPMSRLTFRFSRAPLAARRSATGGQALSSTHTKTTDAMKLSALRTACSLPHFSKSVRVSLDARSRPGADSCLFVGIIAMNVNGTTKPISRAPTNHRTPPPSNQAATPARKLKMASEAYMTVARL